MTMMGFIYYRYTLMFQGGFKLQILDALDRPLVDLTPVTHNSEFIQTDAT